MSTQYKLIKCTINGRPVEQMVDVRASLTDMLRNDFRLTSVKKGCEVGECGACNVLIDGKCYNSCIYLAAWADGKQIRTLEGLMGPGGPFPPQYVPGNPCWPASCPGDGYQPALRQQRRLPSPW